MAEQKTGSNAAVLRGVFARSPLFTELDRADIALLTQRVTPEVAAYGAGGTVVHYGALCESVGVLATGALASKSFYEDGKVQTMKLYEPGDVLCLDAAASRLGTAPHDIMARRRSVVAWFPYQEMVCATACSPTLKEGLTKNLFAVLTDELIRMGYKADILAQRTARERILSYLHLLSIKRGTRRIELSLTQQELAEYLCLARATLGAELRKLREEGILQVSGRTVILLPTELQDALF